MLNIMFYQPQADLLSRLEQLPLGKPIILFLNYSIWIFLFFVSIILIRHDPTYFWVLFFCTLASELVERLFKQLHFWPRPLFKKRKSLPIGLVSSWYHTGSFPSGHTYKVTYFFLLVFFSGVMSPAIFLAISIPLILFRVAVGFHYPIDVLGGAILGTITWLLFHSLTLPTQILDITNLLFNTVFYYVL
jgi:membrane-associated phospholipid phosphatase